MANATQDQFPSLRCWYTQPSPKTLNETKPMIQTLTKQLRAFGVIALILGFLASCASTPSTVVWLDVRTDAEYAEDHIDGSAHIPHDEIAARVAELGLEKGAEIRVYCRTGVRAGIALATLQELGYNNAENVGGISDARLLRD